MTATELIRKKRDGNSLSAEEFHFLIDSYVKGAIPDYQMSSFLMATFFRGMSSVETITFTDLMLHSGDVVDLSGIPGIKVDKHSTGGVGDKISLLLAPIVAACGVPVPMISGRGLGHTGGTLDKLESIPGFNTSLSIDEYKKVIAEIGVVMIGQTKEIAPADKKMYALRDVTATVECIPLIAGSIMSKKLAEGIDALVLDVKTGRGAFMPTYERSVELAQTLVNIGNSFGKETIGFITDMNQPLGYAIGNWNEVVESVEGLRGRDLPDIMELTYVLSGAMVMLGGKAGSMQEAIEACKATVADGSAYAKLVDLVRRQGGNPEYLDHPERYPVSRYVVPVMSEASGVVTSIDSLELGLSSILLGAGRTTVDDVIDPKAGILLAKKAGDQVAAGDVLATISTDKEEAIGPVADRVRRAYTVGDKAPEAGPIVISQVDRHGVRKFSLTN
ncbi:MAG: thymidine phosphorylase [Ignavibacteriales bacterium]|nr:thymidine phosphorylase [Ignavibacteriales bacterium]